jgi:hypothetical protein
MFKKFYIAWLKRKEARLQANLRRNYTRQRLLTEYGVLGFYSARDYLQDQLAETRCKLKKLDA